MSLPQVVIVTGSRDWIDKGDAGSITTPHGATLGYMRH